MKWDALYLLKGLPPEYRIYGDDLCMVNVGDDWLNTIQKLAENGEHDLKGVILRFISGVSAKAFTLVGIRIENAQTEDDALKAARKRLNSVLDGIVVLMSTDVPEVSTLVHVRQGDDANVRIVHEINRGFIQFNPPQGSTSGETWEKRNQAVLNELLRFWDITEGKETPTPLQEQIVFSAKMYRQGASAEDYGVQFLCKFCALEGLVTGGERQKKEAKFKDRLKLLFTENQSDIAGIDLDEIWRLRNDIAHESRTSSESVHIESLDRLFTAAFIHALRKMDTANTVSDLWKNYDLPQDILMKRPDDMGQMTISSGSMNTNILAQGFGKQIDQCFEKTRKGLQQLREQRAKENK